MGGGWKEIKKNKDFYKDFELGDNFEIFIFSDEWVSSSILQEGV